MLSPRLKRVWQSCRSSVSAEGLEEAGLDGSLLLTGPFLMCRFTGDQFTQRGKFAQAAAMYRVAMRLKLLTVDRGLVARVGQGDSARGPDFIIIGAAKSGTTSLFAYLSSHPRVLPPIRKEIRFFNHVERGLNWYLAHFPPRPEDGETYLTGEGSTSYLCDTGVPRSLYELFPRTKLILILRDPVARAISHYHDDRRRSDETRPLDEAMSTEMGLLEGLSNPVYDAGEYWRSGQRGYLCMGLYVYFLKHWVEVFPKEQLLVLQSSGFYSDPAATMRQVFEFVGVPDHPLVSYDVHLAGSYPPAEQAVRKRLAAFFRPHNEKLQDYLGRELHWS